MDVMTRVREHYEVAKALVPEDRIVGVFLYGSQNYGMDGPNSDVDTKCLVIPSFEEVALNKKAANFEYHFDNGEHLKVIDIREFLRLVKKQNPNDLEILFTKYCVRNNTYAGIWYYLWSHREDVAHYRPHRAIDTMRHMANKEYYNVEKKGFNTKSLALIFRLTKMAQDYLLCKFYEDILVSDEADFLKRVKYGEFVAPEDEETGMRMMRNSIEAINRLVDRYLAKTEDVVNEKTGALIDKVSKDFMAASLDYEIVEYRSKR